MNQVDQLLQALAQRQQMYDQSYGNVLDTQKRSMDANSQRYHRGLFGMGEAIYDAIRRPKADREYNDSLVEAMKSARGVDDITAQLQAMQEAAALEEQRNWELYKDDYIHSRDTRTKREDAEAEHRRDREAAAEDFKREQGGRMALKQYEVDNRAPPKQQTVEVLGEDGATYRHILNPDGSLGESIGITKPAPEAEGGKDLDVQEALGVLDEAEELLKQDKGFLSGTGPIQGRTGAYTEWNQEFQAKADALFQLAKRIYKTKGEGVFTDADAAALRGMLFSPTRDEQVNLNVINSLRKSLSSRSPDFQGFMTEAQGLSGGEAEGTIQRNKRTGEMRIMRNGQWEPYSE